MRKMLTALTGLFVAITAAAAEFAVLGDSYSTFEGVIPKTNGTWYQKKGARNDVTDAREMWWHLVAEDTGLKRGTIDAWTSTTICNRGYRGQDCKDRSFLARVDRLGKPDIIFVCGATNDDWAGVPLGEFKKSAWTDEELYTFRPGLAKLLSDLKARYPKAKIYFILNSELKAEINESVHRICKENKIPCIDLHDIEKQSKHPSRNGMRAFADQVIARLAADGVVAKPKTPKNGALRPRSRLEDDSYDWWARHDRVLSEAKAMKPEIVLLGDSITHHWAGVNSLGALSDPETTPYFRTAFGGKAALDLGFGWDRTQNLLWRLRHGELDGLAPKQVVMMIGTNNLTDGKGARRNTPAEIVEGVLECAREVRARLPKAELTVMGILPRGNRGDPLRADIKAINAQLAAKAKKAGFRFLDISDKFLEANGDRKAGLYRDLVHLTPNGYMLWAQALKADAAAK